MGTEGSPEATARLREAMGLNRPIAIQYAQWLWSALRGDLGVSIQYDLPVGRLIVSRLPVTLPLTLLAACLMSVTALPLGLYAATRHRRAGPRGPAGRLLRGGLRPARHRGPVFLGGAAAAPPLRRAARLGAVGRLGGMVRRARGGDPLEAARLHPTEPHGEEEDQQQPR